jgi:hypothetical protein
MREAILAIFLILIAQLKEDEVKPRRLKRARRE